MPTNVPPQYREAEARYRAATTSEDKIAILEEMLRMVPKHKGTEKLQADLKNRLSKLRNQSGSKGGARAASHMIPKEGAGQVALVGPPNSGKSSLVDRTTHATPKVGEYPFTTREALPGMMPYKDVAVQLVDLPPVSEEHTEPWVFDSIRRADLIWVVVTHAASLDEFEEARALVEAKRIELYPVGRTPGDDASSAWHKQAVVVLTGGDEPGSQDNFDAFQELLGHSDGDPNRILWPTFLVSSVDGRGLNELAALSFEAMNVIRVYTKQPGKPPDTEKPFTVPRDSTVGHLAAVIHKDLSENIKFARMWGKSVFDGQRVQADHVLTDGDVVEIHI